MEKGLTYDKKRVALTSSSQFIDDEINLENYLSTVTKVNTKANSQDLNIVGNDVITDNYNQTQTYSCILEILYDNNFISDEFELDDISEVTDKNYSLGELEYSNNNNDFMNDSIVTTSSFDEK